MSASALRASPASPRVASWLIAGCLLGCGSTPKAEAQAVSQSAASTPVASAGWLKGQLHLHSNASGDSETPPDAVVRWYAEHGYDFIVFTDHNRVTEAPGVGEMLVMPGVELTQNLERCDPPPEGGDAVRAERDPRALREALRDGEFYASTGVVLEKVSFEGGVLEVRVGSGAEPPFEVRFIADGTVVQRSTDAVSRYDTAAADHTYVRATVVDGRGRTAWVQPVFP